MTSVLEYALIQELETIRARKRNRMKMNILVSSSLHHLIPLNHPVQTSASAVWTPLLSTSWQEGKCQAYCNKTQLQRWQKFRKKMGMNFSLASSSLHLLITSSPHPFIPSSLHLFIPSSPSPSYHKTLHIRLRDLISTEDDQTLDDVA